MFKNLSDFDATQPPLRFAFDKDMGLVVPAEDVLTLLNTTKVQIARTGIQMSMELTDTDKRDAVIHHAAAGAGAVEVAANFAESLFMECNLHGEGTEVDFKPETPKGEDKDGKPGFGFGQYL